jgi:hypothetical protein
MPDAASATAVARPIPESEAVTMARREAHNPGMPSITHGHTGRPRDKSLLGRCPSNCTLSCGHARAPHRCARGATGATGRADTGRLLPAGRPRRLLHARSFERVAGPKPDQFQTDVTAALFTAVSTALIAGTRKSAPRGAVRVLAISAPIAVAIIDLRHRQQIRRLFRLEAALEIVFAVPPPFRREAAFSLTGAHASAL